MSRSSEDNSVIIQISFNNSMLLQLWFTNYWVFLCILHFYLTIQNLH